MLLRLLLLCLASLLLSCAAQEHYPPALPAPATNGVVPWDNGESFILKNPPAPSQVTAQPPAPISIVPSDEEWQHWRPYVPPKMVCQGKGKHKRCKAVERSPVEAANVTAVVKPSHVHTLYGQSILVRYPLVLGGLKVYPIETSPQEFTRLLLPPGERRAGNLRLHPKEWVVEYEPSDEDSRQEVISIRPTTVDLRARDMLLLASGYPIYLTLTSREEPGMLSVTWTMPTMPKDDTDGAPLDQKPPTFQSRRAYTGYNVILEGDDQLRPPWMPSLVVDDGMNTLVKFAASLEGQQMPAVVGLDQVGKPIIVASRLYIHRDQAPTGQGSFWLYIQGLHPAFLLKDSAGLTVRVVRQVPSQEVSYVH